MRNILHYLATPIKHPNSATVNLRYNANREAMHTLSMTGFFVYSPMLHYYDVKTVHNWTTDWETWWKEKSLFMVQRCDIVIVLQLHGWMESEGVAAEVIHGINSHKMVYAMENSRIPQIRPMTPEEMVVCCNRRHGKQLRVNG